MVNRIHIQELGTDWLESYKDEHGNYPTPDGALIEYPLIDISLEALGHKKGLFELGKFLCNPEFPLMIEYQAAKKCHREMKERVSRAQIIDELFD